jgi:hypothetical protein
MNKTLFSVVLLSACVSVAFAHLNDGSTGYTFGAVGGSDPYADFTYSDGLIYAIGTLDVTGNVVTGGFMNVDYPAASSPELYTLDPGAGSDGYFVWDNEIELGQPVLLDNDGLLFSAADGSEVNIWGNGASNDYSFYEGANGGYPYNDGQPGDGTFTVSLTPEPFTMCLAAAGLGLALKRRVAKTA